MDDVTVLSYPNNWPGQGSKRYCAVKTYKNTPEGEFPPLDNFGMLVALDGCILSTTYGHGVSILREGFAPINYDSIEAMVADGWMVD